MRSSFVGGLTPINIFVYHSKSLSESECQLISNMAEILAYERNSKNIEKFFRSVLVNNDPKYFLILCQHIITAVIPKLNSLLANIHCGDVMGRCEYKSVREDLLSLTNNVRVLSGMLANANIVNVTTVKSTLMTPAAQKIGEEGKYRRLI